MIRGWDLYLTCGYLHAGFATGLGSQLWICFPEVGPSGTGIQGFISYTGSAPEVVLLQEATQ